MPLNPAQEAFLQDTINFYGENPTERRSIVYLAYESVCRYRTRDGRKCAIGRHMPDDKYQERFDLGGEGVGLAVTHMDVFSSLPKEIQDLGEKFLERIQNLHDKDKFWAESGLSSEGLEYVETLRY